MSGSGDVWWVSLGLTYLPGTGTLPSVLSDLGIFYSGSLLLFFSVTVARSFFSYPEYTKSQEGSTGLAMTQNEFKSYHLIWMIN